MDQLNLFDLLRNDLFSDIKPHIVEKFFVYHRDNPHVFDLFYKYTCQLKNTGRRHYGAQMVFERMRWHYAVETQGDEFKINNNYVSCYTRLLAQIYPEFKDFFETRCTPGTARKVRA